MMTEPKNKVEVEQLLKHEIPEIPVKFDTKDAILYALGRNIRVFSFKSLGFSNDPLNKEDMSYTYENSDDFQVFPTYASVFTKPNIKSAFQFIPKFDQMMLLHGEQRCQIYRTPRPDLQYISSGKISNVSDKGSGLLLTAEFRVYEKCENQREIAFINTMSLFIRGLGGFGFQGQGGGLVFPQIPSRKPDALVSLQTNPNQAILYRLSGDYNPLHIDPNMAKQGNFNQPILHGMCFYGMVAKGAVQSLLKNDSQSIQVVQARFIGHVFPGQTVNFSYWKDGNVIIFHGNTQERSKDIITGFIELHEQPLL